MAVKGRRMSEARYTIAELADKSGVPRTTINDWLSRYAQYIDFKMQGRRRLYTDKSVEVLVEIAKLRSEGKSSFEIDEELAKKHPVHGEVTPPPMEIKSTSEESVKQIEADNQNSALPTETLPQTLKPMSQEEYSLIAKKQSDEIASMISAQIKMMSERISEMEEQSRNNAAKASKWISIAFILLAVIVIIGLAALIKTSAFFKENLNLQSERNNLLKTLNHKEEMIQDKSNQVIRLEKNNGDLSQELKKLEAEKTVQQKEFELLLKENKGMEAETAKLREELAARKLEELKKLEAASSVINKEAEKKTEEAEKQ